MVYLSPYQNFNKYKDIINIITTMKKFELIVYSNFQNMKDTENCIFKPFGTTFKNDLLKSKFLISTSGHQLISEAILINKPILTIPLDTFEQHYNAKMLKKYKLGDIIKTIDSKEIENFYNKIIFYKKNIKNFKYKYYKTNWMDEIDKILNNILFR